MNTYLESYEVGLDLAVQAFKSGGVAPTIPDCG